MPMKRKMLSYIFSVFILCSFINASSQESLDYRVVGPRIGFDVSRLALFYLEPGRVNFELSGDLEIRELNYYAVLEVGWQQIDFEGKNYNYSSGGLYGRLGLDYNFLNLQSPDDYEMLYAGGRYGYSRFNHQADQIIITENYWGEYQTSVPKDWVNAHWLELIVGIKAELSKNLFIGWDIRGKFLLHKSGNGVMDPYNIPGFGNGSRRVAIGFSYTVAYRIPVTRKRVTINFQNPE